MNILYIVMIPLFSLIIYKRINYIIMDIKVKNQSKLKVDLFFLVIVIIMVFILLYLISIK